MPSASLDLEQLRVDVLTVFQHDESAASLATELAEAENANRGLRHIGSLIETHAGHSK